MGLSTRADYLDALTLPGRLTFGVGVLAAAYLMALAASRVSRRHRGSDLQPVLADAGAMGLLFAVLLALMFVTSPPARLQLACEGRRAPQPRRSGD